MLARLGAFAYRRRLLVLGGWMVVALLGLLLGGRLFDRLGPVDQLPAQAESVRGERQIQVLSDDGPVAFAVVTGVEVYDPALVASVTELAERLRQVPGVVEVDDLYTGRGGQIGADNRSTLVRVSFAEDLDQASLETAEDAVSDLLHQIQAPSVLVGGDHLAQRAFGEQALKDLATGESVALVALLLALVVIFGGAVAASVPLFVAVVGVNATVLALLVVSGLAEVGEYSLNVVTLLGLGLAVDYALLIVARFREERARAATVEAAVILATMRAGRAVVFSGLAVAGAMAGLYLLADPLLASMAVGGSVVVLVTTALAVTAVPALLAVAGERVPPAGAQTWVTRLVAPVRGSLGGRPLIVRTAAFAQRHPAMVALATSAALLALALPLAGANFANSDARALPASVEARAAYDSYQRLFGGGTPAPVTVVAAVDATSPELRDYLNRLQHLPDVFRLSLRPDMPEGSVIIDLTPTGTFGPSADSTAVNLVDLVRGAPPAFPVLVTGTAAELVDYRDSALSRLPYLVVVVILVMAVLLFALTRSVVVAAKAVALACLTLLATLGVVVATFQWGWGQRWLGFESWGGVDVTTPLLLFVFIFGLTMDYEVFLLARIKEEYDRGIGNNRAVLEGIARSGPVVTAAAACITIVFAGFAFGGLVAVKEIGVGMAVAVVLDATVVRGLLLPAVMTLLGERNWWAPKALRARRG